jgi:hypothetical protein
MSVPERQATVSSPESFMDERQKRVFNELTVGRPDLADMYRAALSQLSKPAETGDARTRISYICHSMREVMNRVLGPKEAGDGDWITPPTSDQVQALPDLLVDFPDLTLDSQGESVPVPQGVAAVFYKLIRTAVQEKRRSRDKVASLLTDDGNSGHAVVTRWMESRKFFVDWAHLRDRQSESGELPSDELIRTHVAVFDELFDGVITAFFARRHSIDDLLAQINEPEEEGDDD